MAVYRGSEGVKLRPRVLREIAYDVAVVVVIREVLLKSVAPLGAELDVVMPSLCLRTLKAGHMGRHRWRMMIAS